MEPDTTRSTAHRPAVSPAAPRLSALAVSGLVVSLVPCCPFIPLVGMGLGLLAMRRIRRSGGRLTGFRIALAAIIVGAAGAIVSSVLVERWVVGQQAVHEEAMASQAAELVRSAQAGAVDEVLANWSDSDGVAPSAETLIVFGRETSSRFGALDRVAIISTAPESGFLSLRIEVAAIFHFERGSPLGSARFRMQTTPGRLTPTFRPIRLIIEDDEAGDLAVESVADAPVSEPDGG